MKVIAKVDTFSGRYKKASGCIPTKTLGRIEVNDDHIGPKEWFTDIEEKLQLIPTLRSLTAGDTTSLQTQWNLWCTFLRDIVARIPDCELFSEKTHFNAVDDIRAKVYIGNKYVPNTFGAVRLVKKMIPLSNGNHKVGFVYQVYSPFLRNNRYNGGDLFFHNASTNKLKILRLMNARVRQPLAEERHLYEFSDVLNAQRESLTARERISADYASQVSNWNHRDQVLAELVSLYRHIKKNAENVDTGKMSTYTFLSNDLYNVLDNYTRELAELGDAIDTSLEGSSCWQRVHIITGEKSGKSFFSRTVIHITGKNSWNHGTHAVYGDTVDAAYAPIETMPEEIGSKIAVLNMLQLNGTEGSELTWVLNTGTVITKNELYYLPVDVDTLSIDT